MTYEINKSSGIKLDDLNENELLVIGDSANGITLFGKNTTNYGEKLNENFLRLLENFAKPNEPNEPIVGQLWWDTNNNLLKIRSGIESWKVVGTPVFDTAQPQNPINGDLWYDSSPASQQLKIYNNGWQTIGPEKVAGKGSSGVDVEILNGVTPLLKVTVGSEDIAIFSQEEVDLTDTGKFLNFPRQILPGINLRSSNPFCGINTGSMIINDTGIVPTANATENLGSAEYKWNNVYATRFLGDGSQLTNVAATSATTAQTSTTTSSVVIVPVDINDQDSRFVPFVASTSGNQAMLTKGDFKYTPHLGGSNLPGLLEVPKVKSTQFESIATTGTAPFIVASTTKVDNLQAATAAKWHSSINLAISGAVTGSASIDGSGNVTIGTTLASIAGTVPTSMLNGAFVSSVTNGTGVTITSTQPGGTFGNTISIAIGQEVGTSSNVQFNSIGVGGAAPGTSGQIRATEDIIGFYSSDASLKENILPIENALEKVTKLNGVRFDWNDRFIEAQGGEDGYFVRKKDIGVIAQDVVKVFPEIVATRSNGTMAVKYDRLVSVLIEAVKELSAKVNGLETELKTYKRIN